MTRVDKMRLRAAFSRSAGAYDAGATLQGEIAVRVGRLAREAAPAARRILDVGCGTGALLAALPGPASGSAGETVEGGGRAVVAGLDLALGMARAARSRLPSGLFAAGDAEALPFRSGAFDLVLSTSTFQWVGNLDAALAEVRRVLAPGGSFALALFCGETLHELREAWRGALRAGEPAATHEFRDPAEIREAMAGAGLRAHRFEVERHVAWHPSVRDLLASLRAIGAGNAVAGRGGGLGLRRALLETSRRYEAAHGRDGRVPATWDVAVALARRA